MKKAWLYIVAAVVLLYLFTQKSAAAKNAANNSGGDKTVQVDAAALAAYKDGSATSSQLVKLGWPFIAEASLSWLSGQCGVLGPLTNGPDVRASDELGNACTEAAMELDPSYNTTIDGCSAKLAYLNARLQQTGRPKVYGFENQAQPHIV